MASTPRDVARDLARLIRGEIEVRDFPWLSDKERRALGALGMSMLRTGKAALAKAAFGVLIDLEPDSAVHHLMFGHASALGDEVQNAFRSFGRAISLVAMDERNREVASEAFLARGDLLLRLGRTVEARADLADAATRMSDPARRRSIEVFLAA
jgi:CubicO group peptidase (beta-lactamase class C family)